MSTEQGIDLYHLRQAITTMQERADWLTERIALRIDKGEAHRNSFDLHEVQVILRFVIPSLEAEWDAHARIVREHYHWGQGRQGLRYAEKGSA